MHYLRILAKQHAVKTAMWTPVPRFLAWLQRKPWDSGHVSSMPPVRPKSGRIAERSGVKKDPDRTAQSPGAGAIACSYQKQSNVIFSDATVHN